VVHKLFDHHKTVCGLRLTRLLFDERTTDWEEVTCRRCTNSTFAPNMIRLGFGEAMKERNG
jgi:hypothetical protein